MLTCFDKAVHNVVLRLGRQAPDWPLDVPLLRGSLLLDAEKVAYLESDPKVENLRTTKK